jgi:transcription initiation factor TFIIE subunit alpha
MLAGIMGLQAKEVNKMMAVLEKDQLIQVCATCGRDVALPLTYFVQPPPERAQGRRSEVRRQTVFLPRLQALLRRSEMAYCRDATHYRLETAQRSSAPLLFFRLAHLSLMSSCVIQELDNQGYICGQCKKQFSPLDVDKLIDMMLGVFVCDVCHGVVDSNHDDENVRGSKDRMQRFNDQMLKIRDGLRRSEEMTMPKYVPHLSRCLP